MLQLRYQVVGKNADDINQRASAAVAQYLSGRKIDGTFDLVVRSRAETQQGDIVLWEADVTWTGGKAG